MLNAGMATYDIMIFPASMLFGPLIGKAIYLGGGQIYNGTLIFNSSTSVSTTTNNVNTQIRLFYYK